MRERDYEEYCELLGFRAYETAVASEVGEKSPGPSVGPESAPPLESEFAPVAATPGTFASDYADLDFEQLRSLALGCPKCRLSQTRKHVVFGDGNPQAQLMFVGEAPGFNEDQQGRPFVGQAGELLDKMIVAMGYRRQDVYIANVIKCRPPENRDPQPDEVAACTPYLERQVELIRPKAVVALGTFAAQCLLKKDLSISKLRGQAWPARIGSAELTIFPTFHPAYLLRNAERKKDVWEDLKKVMAFLNSP